MYHLVDFKTKQRVHPTNLIFTGENNPWEVVIDLNRVKTSIHLDYFRQEPPCLAKYLPLLPIKDPSHFVSLNEPQTPLIKSKSIGKSLNIDLFFKVEGKNPTGSFKDRGSAVDVSIAKEKKANGIILASTGNMAASCCCYATLARIPCFVLVPEGLPAAKLSQVIAFGGHVVQIKGSYNDAARLARSIAEKRGFFLSGDYAFRVEGQKTAAYELIDQLFFNEPDLVVVPMGCGTNIASYVKGFREYLQLGLIHRIPQLIGVQAEGACPIVNSYRSHLSTIEAVKQVNTIASAIAIDLPIDGTKALEAIYSTNGMAVAVSDEEILKAQLMLSVEEGLFTETSSAATLAALIKLNSQSDFKGKKIVCILTGDGLKDPTIILQAVMPPPAIDPNEQEVLSVIENILANQTNLNAHQ